MAKRIRPRSFPTPYLPRRGMNRRSTGDRDVDYYTLGKLYAHWLSVKDHAPYRLLADYKKEIAEFYDDCQSNYEGTF